VDGKKLTDYTDPNPIPEGGISLEAHVFSDSAVSFFYDNMSVCKLSVPFMSIMPPDE